MKLVSLDIDGVLTDYPACWLSYLSNAVGQPFSTTEEAKNTLGQQVYETHKNAYRVSEYKARLPLKTGSDEFWRELAQRGYEFLISTARPPISRPTTERWLAFREIPYRAIIEKRLDATFPQAVRGVALHVDDELPYVQFLLSHNIPAWHLQNDAYEDILKIL